MKTLILFLHVVCLGIAQEENRYDGYQILQVSPLNSEAEKYLMSLMGKPQYDFMSFDRGIGSNSTVMIAAEALKSAKEEMDKREIQYRTVVENVKNYVDESQMRINQNRVGAAFDPNKYNTLEAINDWLNYTAAHCLCDSKCEFYSIGKSIEGRDIMMFKISKTGASRKAFWIDATIHAREWLATATALKILHQLATAADADAVRLVNDYDWYILPVMNPDGYKYSWEHARLWRKNRRMYGDPECSGVDLNRNFDYRWSKQGSSSDSCTNIYAGPSAASEPETQAVQAEGQRVASTLQAWMTIHSYGDMLMFPWGHSENYDDDKPCVKADNHDDMMKAANIIADAIQNTHQTTWERGTSCEVIYPTTGATDDYAKGVLNVKYTFNPELRGSSFDPEESEIQKSFEEMWAGIKVMPGATAT